MQYIYTMEDPGLGPLTLTADEEYLLRISFSVIPEAGTNEEESLRQEPNDVIIEAVRQLREYLNHQRKGFTIPVRLNGTDFQIEVWNALLSIPYGQTSTYSELGNVIGRPNAQRAIGQACKANQLPILIPCHRVIGRNGKLTGYDGDKTPIKKLLLDIESPEKMSKA